MSVVTLHLDTKEPKDIARNVRIGGLIGLELGDKSKWVLVYKSEDGRTFLVTAGERVRAREAAEVLIKMGKGLEDALTKVGR